VRLYLSPIALFAALLGCDAVTDFSGRSYEGAIVPGGFVRSCFGDGVTASVELDPKLLSLAGASSTPSTLSTDDGVFNRTPLVAFPVLVNDNLSQLDFPGAERLRNYLLTARPESGPLAGRDAIVVVSLLDNQRIELRVLARSLDGSADCATASEDDDATPRQYFGVFTLREKKKSP
jgi:hypothetical protein